MIIHDITRLIVTLVYKKSCSICDSSFYVIGNCDRLASVNQEAKLLAMCVRRNALFLCNRKFCSVWKGPKYHDIDNGLELVEEKIHIVL